MTAPVDTKGSVSTGTCCHDWWNGTFRYRQGYNRSGFKVDKFHLYAITCPNCNLTIRVAAFKGKTRWGLKLK